MKQAAETENANPAPPWHAQGVPEVLAGLTTDLAVGLDAPQAAARLERYGPNRLPAGKQRGPFLRFLAQLNNVLVYVLLGAGFTKLMLGLWIDAGIILGVVLINALLGFIQEGKAEKALESIRNMLSPRPWTCAGARPADRRDDLVPRRHRAAGVRRQDAGGPAAGRDARTCAPRRPPSPANPCRSRSPPEPVPGRRPWATARHGLLGDPGGLRPGARGGGRHRRWTEIGRIGRMLAGVSRSKRRC